ncbi:MAG: hypothetical protein NC820_08185 [Candidatus Omnitrophica bacterium]|nr:hypothetical protein [Candidatus Omnitrophota bacterium]
MNKKLNEDVKKALYTRDREFIAEHIGQIKDPYLVYRYAEEIVRGKVSSRLENIIAKGAGASFYYARYILRNRFLKGEDAIAKDAYYSYWYSKNVLKAPFRKGEKSIAKNVEMSNWYAQVVLKERFRKGEKSLVKCDTPWFLANYCEFLQKIGKLKEFLKDFPEVRIILKDTLKVKSM